ncbi:hypothetical protein [Pasteurella phage vB_PmuP_PS07]|nr:hypothetical protein [Pasteurella phage vB_PmuP_PS07]UIS74025.1 hypothetical protein [Pasteurella phage vB_PmuP_PS30]
MYLVHNKDGTKTLFKTRQEINKHLKLSGITSSTKRLNMVCDTWDNFKTYSAHVASLDKAGRLEDKMFLVHNSDGSEAIFKTRREMDNFLKLTGITPTSREYYATLKIAADAYDNKIKEPQSNKAGSMSKYAVLKDGKYVIMDEKQMDDYLKSKGVFDNTSLVEQAKTNAKNKYLGLYAAELKDKLSKQTGAAEYPQAKSEATPDAVTTQVQSPSHYAVFDGQGQVPNLEAIEVIARNCTPSEWAGYCKGNILKYRLRVGKKSSGSLSDFDKTRQDLMKADKYQELYKKLLPLTIGYTPF